MAPTIFNLSLILTITFLGSGVEQIANTINNTILVDI